MAAATSSETVAVHPHHLTRFRASSRAGSYFLSIEFGLSDGRTAGYYGQRDGTHLDWLVHRPLCKIAYFSGYAGERIDQVYVHWVC